MIGFEMDIDQTEDSVIVTFIREGETFELEMSYEAFSSLAIALDHAAQSDNYKGHMCFDLDDE